jgi:hypothetical protein
MVLGLRNTQRVRIRRGLLAAVANPRTLVPSVVHERGDEDEDEGDQYPEPETHVISLVSGRRDSSIGMAWREEWRFGSHLDEPTIVAIKADVLTAPMVKARLFTISSAGGMQFGDDRSSSPPEVVF